MAVLLRLVGLWGTCSAIISGDGEVEVSSGQHVVTDAVGQLLLATWNLNMGGCIQLISCSSSRILRIRSKIGSWLRAVRWLRLRVRVGCSEKDVASYDLRNPVPRHKAVRFAGNSRRHIFRCCCGSSIFPRLLLHLTNSKQVRRTPGAKQNWHQPAGDRPRERAMVLRSLSMMGFSPWST